MRRRLALAGAVAVMALGTHAVIAEQKPAPQGPAPVEVKVEPWPFSPVGGTGEHLALRGAIRLSSDDPRFGGFSGLAVSADGGRLLAVSDDGWWLKGNLQYTDEILSGFTGGQMAPLKGPQGRRLASKRLRDAEAVVTLSPKGLDGPVAVGFERVPRVETFPPGRDGFPDRPRPMKMPRDVETGTENEELEAIALLTAGDYRGMTAAFEEGDSGGNGASRGWVFGGKRPFQFSVRLAGTYRLTDAAVLPSGDLLLLERSFAAPAYIPGMAVRLIKAADLKPKALIEPVTLFKGEVPRYLVDNMEGLAVWQDAQGRTRLLVMSDDNYARDRQSTILVDFLLTLPEG